MINAETGDIEKATKHLNEALRLDPSDAPNWVVLGNLYASGESDLATADTFIRRALEMNPGDTWALNRLVAFTHKAGRSQETLHLLARAIEANADLPPRIRFPLA